VRHSSFAAQDWPSRFLSPQRLVLGSQMLGEAQLASETHAVAQAVPLQTNGAHASVLAARQVPAPSHVRARVSVVAPTGQDAAAQVVPAA
jgi:hypothetical protein